MNIKNGIVDTLEEYGLNITVERSSQVKILKFDGTFNTKYAQKYEE